jgi:zinc resistance-associated protein
MKRIAIVLGSLMLIAAVAYPVLAHGPGWGRGHHMMGNWGGGQDYCWQGAGAPGNLTEGQQGKLDNLHRKFYDDTNNLRSEIGTKSTELNTLLNGTDPDAVKAKALQKEIMDLKARLAEKHLNLELEARKIVPDARFGSGYGKGYNRYHMRGYGPGMGYGGRYRGGYGPGNCWN